MGVDVKWNGFNPHLLLEGVISYFELNNSNNFLIGHSNFDNMTYQLWDLRQIEDFNLTIQEMKVIGTLDKSAGEWNRSIKVALVVADKKTKDLCKYYASLMTGTKWSIQIFEDFDTADIWCKR